MRKPLALVWLRERDLARMIVEARHFAPKETGGVFIGYRARGEIVITDVVLSGPNAVHDRRSYRSDPLFESNEIARIYEQSGRMHSYLGDWHSHPAGSFRLSGKDKRALRTIARSEDARAEKPIMAILAGERDDWGIGVWEYFERSIKFVPGAVRSGRIKLY